MIVKMKKEEIQEVIDLLETAGLNPMLCDTLVHQSSVPVRCGCPMDFGDDDGTEYMKLPGNLIDSRPTLLIPVKGESMRDIGYEPDDKLQVVLGDVAHDTDVVLVSLDNRATVKTLFTDADGTKWLVPQNDAYDPIQLTDDMDVRILGVVVGVIKDTPRISTRDLQRSVQRMKNKNKTARELSDKEVDDILVCMGHVVKHARQWYAVYRMMVDRRVQKEGDFKGFCERIVRLLPNHAHQPVAKEISRMAVLSFDKPVSLWISSNAPVGGTRFKDYLNIALLMGSYLSGETDVD